MVVKRTWVKYSFPWPVNFGPSFSANRQPLPEKQPHLHRPLPKKGWPRGETLEIYGSVTTTPLALPTSLFLYLFTLLCKKNKSGDFPGGPLIKDPTLQCRGCNLDTTCCGAAERMGQSQRHVLQLRPKAAKQNF